MTFVEILVIIAAVLIVSIVFGRLIYKRIKHMPSEECASCKNSKKFNKAIQKARMELNTEAINKEACNCNHDITA